MEREHGRIVSVSTETLGSTLTADVASGATVLPVYDAAAFDAENGGSVSVNGAVLAYSTSDDDASTVTLTDPLPAAASEGDRVDCWNPLYRAAFTVKTAMVQLDGDDDNPDPIECLVFNENVSNGDRGGPGESCVVEYDEEEDEWTVVHVRGLSDQAGVKFYDHDTFTVSAAGPQVFTLTKEPIDGSVHMIWCGLDQPSSEFTRNGSVITVPDPDGLVKTGDIIDFKYAYRVAADTGFSITTTSGTDNPVSAPAESKPGDLMLLAITLPSDVSGASNLNGYTLIGETASVTHSCFNGSRTYRLAIYARTAPDGTIPVPTFPSSTNQTPWVLGAISGSSGVKASAFATLADGQSAGTPALAGADLRVWATVANQQTITPSTGTVIGESNGNDDIDIVAVTYNGTGGIPASVATTAGWMMATLNVGGQ